MAGIANSWIGEVYAQPTPCITDTPVNQITNNTTVSSCLIWLVVGLLLGSIRFEKKGSQQ
jgi:hypothetical protein